MGNTIEENSWDQNLRKEAGASVRLTQKILQNWNSTNQMQDIEERGTRPSQEEITVELQTVQDYSREAFHSTEFNA